MCHCQSLMKGLTLLRSKYVSFSRTSGASRATFWWLKIHSRSRRRRRWLSSATLCWWAFRFSCWRSRHTRCWEWVTNLNGCFTRPSVSSAYRFCYASWFGSQTQAVSRKTPISTLSNYWTLWRRAVCVQIVKLSERHAAVIARSVRFVSTDTTITVHGSTTALEKEISLSSIFSS